MNSRNSADPAPLDVVERARREVGDPAPPRCHLARGDVAGSKGRPGSDALHAAAREVAA